MTKGQNSFLECKNQEADNQKILRNMPKMQNTANYCNLLHVLQNNTKFSKILQHIAKILQNIAEYCKILHNTTNYCKILHNISKYCKILQNS
jgi:hypothetical protein